MKRDYPGITFKLSRRKTSKADRIWLTQKKDQFSKKWKAEGVRILRKVEKNCGLAFSNKAKKEGMEVYLHKWRREDEDYLGNMTETEPLKLNIYLKKRTTWRSVKSTLTIDRSLRSYSAVHRDFRSAIKSTHQALDRFRKCNPLLRE
jgi:hypothetical protein